MSKKGWYKEKADIAVAVCGASFVSHSATGHVEKLCWCFSAEEVTSRLLISVAPSVVVENPLSSLI